MTTAEIHIGDDETTIGVLGDGDEAVLPHGMVSLGAAYFTADPPLPAELTNAIGAMLDLLDDAKRQLPALIDVSRVVVRGRAAAVVSAVEVGGALDEVAFTLTRDAAEDVFRTLATEPVGARARNPGLPESVVDVVVGGCCAIVAIFRSLHLQDVTVELEHA